VRFYTASHTLWIVAIAAASILLSELSRRDRISKLWLRAALVILMVGGELQRYFKDGMHFPHRMPLHLCNISTWIAVIACIWLSPLAGEFTYFAGLAGAGMAILSPDMGSEWNTRFFVNHGGLIVTAVVLIAGGLIPMRRGAMWRAYALLLTYAALLGAFNWKFGTNYAYLAHKPEQKTVFDLLGPWPYYIGGLAMLGLVIFALLALPLRSRRAASIPRAESRVAAAAAAGRGAATQPQL
jgi:hypothetical integral membrane protein (TIGR02206 family)